MYRFAIASLAVLGLCSCAGPTRAPAPTAALRSEAGAIVNARPIITVVSAPPPVTLPVVEGTSGRDTPAALAAPRIPVTPVETVVTRIIGEPLRPGEVASGVSYTVRRATDGVLIEVAQPTEPALAVGARVQIVYDARVRLVPY